MFLHNNDCRVTGYGCSHHTISKLLARQCGRIAMGRCLIYPDSKYGMGATGRLMQAMWRLRSFSPGRQCCRVLVPRRAVCRLHEHMTTLRKLRWWLVLPRLMNTRCYIVSCGGQVLANLSSVLGTPILAAAYHNRTVTSLTRHQIRLDWSLSPSVSRTRHRGCLAGVKDLTFTLSIH
jgi:hypothetical protein